MSFRALVLAALDAADIAPDSQAGRIALDRCEGVGASVRYAASYAASYRMRLTVSLGCPQIAAVNLVLLATSEAARGVRVIEQ